MKDDKMTEKNDPEINVKDYCNNAAKMLAATKEMVERSLDHWQQTPEQDGEWYNPEWMVSLSQEETSTLIRNLGQARDFFEILSSNQNAAADLLKAHEEAKVGVY